MENVADDAFEGGNYDADDEGPAERIIQIAETRQGSSDHRARPTQLNNTTQYHAIATLNIKYTCKVMVPGSRLMQL